MSFQISDVPLDWLLRCWGPAVDLRIALDEDAVQFVGSPASERRVRQAIVSDFDELHDELSRRRDHVHQASQRTVGGDGDTVWEV